MLGTMDVLIFSSGHRLWPLDTLETRSNRVGMDALATGCSGNMGATWDAGCEDAGDAARD